MIGLEEGGHQVLFSDLHSLVFFRQDPNFRGEKWEEMRFYHHSFSEFLDSESRAQHLFVSEAQVRKYVTESCLQRIPQREDFSDSRESSQSVLPESLTYLSQSGSLAWMIASLTYYYFDPQTAHVDDFRLIDFTRNNGWGVLDEELSSKYEALEFMLNWQGLAVFTFDACNRLNVRIFLLIELR
jgi:hypothetical protein